MNEHKAGAGLVLPVLSATAGFLLWGSSLSMVKIALGSFDPLFVVFARMGLTLVVVTPLALSKFRPKRLPGKKDCILLLLLVLCEPMAAFTFEALAMQYTSASQAGMLWALGPAVYAFGGWLVFRQGITIFKALCFLVAFAGVALLTLSGGVSNQAANPVLGNFFVFLSMLGGAGFVLIIHHFQGRYHPLFIIWLQSLSAVLFMLPGLGLGVIPLPTDVSLPAAGALVYLALAVTLGAQAFGAYAIGNVPVPVYASLSNIIPVSGVLFGLLLLGETLSPIQWAACAIVLAAVIISQRRG